MRHHPHAATPARQSREAIVAEFTARSRIANIRANGVPGVFSVTNHIVVEK